ncbi:DUF4926 domain-containing protein [Chloroflexota bacterium]
MIKPVLFDVVEILLSIPEENIFIGAQGTLVHQHEDDVFEVEFADDKGETIALCTLSSQQFIVVWQMTTKQWVSVAEQVAQVVALLPQQAGSEVLDFARFLSQRRTQGVEYPESVVTQ